MTRSILRPTSVRLLSLAAVPVALLLAAAPASAQFHAQQQTQSQQYPNQRYPQQRVNSQYGYGQQELFDWQGPVDKEVRIAIQGNRASLIRVGNNERVGGRVRTMGGIPAAQGFVTVQGMQGRGRVDVIEQPSPSNNYTTIIRIRDPQGGSDMYHIAAYWQPTGAVNNGQYDRQRQHRRDRDDDDNGYRNNNGGWGNRSGY